MKNKKKSRKNRKFIQKKPAFAIFAEKLMENLKILNEVNECPSCKIVIESNEKICPKCGTELKTKTIKENMDYIKGYLQDFSYTQNEIIYELGNEINKYKKIIEENELEDLFDMKKRDSTDFLFRDYTSRTIPVPWPTGWPKQSHDQQRINILEQRIKKLIKIIRENNLEEFFSDIPEISLEEILGK